MLSCTKCNKIVRSRDNIKRHMLIMHQNKLKKTFKCDDCSKECYFWQCLQIHKGKDYFYLMLHACNKGTMTFKTELDLFNMYCIYVLCVYELLQYESEEWF